MRTLTAIMTSQLELRNPYKGDISMPREQKTKPQIQRFNPVDGEFFLVSKADGSLFAKAYNIQDARFIAAAHALLEALKELSGMEVKGHALIERLQFSEKGRVLATKINNAIALAEGK